MEVLFFQMEILFFRRQDLSKLFLGTLALFLFAFFGFMFFICEGVFLYVLLFCEIILFLYMLLGIFYIRNQKLFYKIFDYFIALQKLFKRKI